jgi:hypothetical protein
MGAATSAGAGCAFNGAEEAIIILSSVKQAYFDYQGYFYTCGLTETPYRTIGITSPQTQIVRVMTHEYSACPFEVVISKRIRTLNP